MDAIFNAARVHQKYIDNIPIQTVNPKDGSTQPTQERILSFEWNPRIHFVCGNDFTTATTSCGAGESEKAYWKNKKASSSATGLHNTSSRRKAWEDSHAAFYDHRQHSSKGLYEHFIRIEDACEKMCASTRTTPNITVTGMCTAETWEVESHYDTSIRRLHSTPCPSCMR